MEPSPALRDLEVRMLQQHPRLDLATPVAGPRLAQAASLPTPRSAAARTMPRWTRARPSRRGSCPSALGGR
jgi:hypothetical protein